MAKKQGKTASSGVDIKALNTKLNHERESLISYGADHGFHIRYKHRAFVVEDLKACTKSGPVVIVPFLTGRPEDYTRYVRNYISKVRKLA